VTEQNENILESIVDRLNQIDNLLKLSLMNNIISECEKYVPIDVYDDIKLFLKKYGFYIIKTDFYMDIFTIYIKSEKKVGIKDFRKLLAEFYKSKSGMILVFDLENATDVQKKKFREEQISYCITGKELFISKNRRYIDGRRSL
jgi:hypothetical protein